jgi:hypothetical protein
MNKDDIIGILDFICYAVMLVLIIWSIEGIRDNTKQIINLLHLNNKITNDILIEVKNGNKR